MTLGTDKNKLIALKLIETDEAFRKQAASLIGRINAQKRNVSKERASEIGRANAEARWNKQRDQATD